MNFNDDKIITVLVNNMLNVVTIRDDNHCQCKAVNKQINRQGSCTFLYYRNGRNKLNILRRSKNTTI